MGAKFNDFRFEGLEHRKLSNQYITMRRYSDDGSRCVVKVDPCMVQRTRYGWALAIDAHHVCWLKSWQVSSNWYGAEVLLQRDYFKVSASEIFADTISEETENADYENWLHIAHEQSENVFRVVRWRIDD